MVYRKYGEDIYSRILDAMSLPGNTLRTYSSFYTTLALVAVELVSLSTITAFLTAVYSVQVFTKLLLGKHHVNMFIYEP